MKGDTKILLASLIFSVFLIIGFAVLGGKSKAEDIDDNTVLGDVSVVQVDPQVYELGDVPIKGGLVNREYKIKNTSSGTIKLKKIATSCMCTKAKVKVGEKETKLFGMEAHGDGNPSVNLEIVAGAEATVTAIFDPAAHGPQGVGPIDRSVFLTFSDPAGIKELKFNGNVIK